MIDREVGMLLMHETEGPLREYVDELQHILRDFEIADGASDDRNEALARAIRRSCSALIVLLSSDEFRKLRDHHSDNARSVTAVRLLTSDYMLRLVGRGLDAAGSIPVSSTSALQAARAAVEASFDRDDSPPAGYNRLQLELDRLRWQVCELSRALPGGPDTVGDKNLRATLLKIIATVIAILGLVGSIVGLTVDYDKFADIVSGRPAVESTIHGGAMICIQAAHACVIELESVVEVIAGREPDISEGVEADISWHEEGRQTDRYSPDDDRPKSK